MMLVCLFREGLNHPQNNVIIKCDVDDKTGSLGGKKTRNYH